MRGLLDTDLAATRRMQHLQDLCGHFTGQPLSATVSGLRESLDRRVSMEDFRRLHILISHLYHRCGATFTEAATLRAEVDAAFARRGQTATDTREEVTTMSCPNENCRKGGCTTDPAPAPASPKR